MNKPRLPFDIEFLLESILYESPDRIDLSGNSNDKTKKSDAERLNSLGAAVPKTGATFKYLSDDAYAFFFDVENGVIMYSEKNTHGSMEEMLRGAAHKATLYAATFKNMYNIKRDMFGNISAYSYKEKQDDGDDAATVSFVGLKQQGDDVETVRDYLHNNRLRFRQLNIRGNADDSATVPAGRIWIKKNAISFWNSKDEIVNENFQLVEKLMSAMKLDKTKFAYEFVDTIGLFAYSELVGDTNKEKLSPEEIKKLLAAQHLDSKAKKKLAGSTYRAAHLKKAAKGFDYAAKADAAIPALEGHIKLKDLIKENPDSVMSQENTKIAHYSDADAIAFFAFKEFSILNIGGVHYDIINTLKDIYENLEDYTSYPDEVESAIEDGGLIFSSAKGLLNALHTGKLGDYFKKYIQKNSNSVIALSGGSSSNIGGFRIESGGLAGRIWNKKKIISFWNKKEIVISRWTEIEKMFSDLNSTLGNLSDYKIDWLERDISVKTPLTSASDVSVSSDPSKNQDDFIDKLFADKKISDEDIKKLQARLHTMSAKEKKKVMMDMGYKNTKASEIADALGMTVAEFNNIMNVNEGDI